MILAAFDDTGYKLVLLLHIIAVVIAFAPSVVHPLTGAALESQPDANRAFVTSAVNWTRKVYAPALVLIGVFGFTLVVMSDEAWSFSDAWVMAAIVIWLLINGVVHGLIVPAEKRLLEGDRDALKILQTAGGVANLLTLAILYLMVFKPGA